MLRLRKGFLPILALCGGTGFAGTMGPVCTPESVTIPCVSGWEVGGAGLYLQNSMEGLGHFGRRTDAAGIGHFDRHSANWAWGFLIDVGYHFGSGKDINVNWYHYDYTSHHTTLDITDRTTGTTISGPSFFTHKPNWDAVNIEFGQVVDYGATSHVRYYGGFEYVNLKLQRNVSSPEMGGPLGTTHQRASQYNGYGARAGARGWYGGLLDNLALYADGAMGLTAGGSTYRSRRADNNTGVLSGDNVDASITVPQLEAKLGGSYGYPISRGMLSLDAGWMWVTYFDPLIEVSHNDLNYYNSSFQGPYVGMKWQGDLI